MEHHQLTNDEIRELVKPTLDEIKGVMGGDWRDALLYLRGSGMRDDECKNWYRYMKTVAIVSAFDNTCAALDGMDWDGDLIFSTDNRVLLDKWRDETVILCAQKKGEKKVPTEQDFIDSNINGFGDDIGKVRVATYRSPTCTMRLLSLFGRIFRWKRTFRLWKFVAMVGSLLPL